MYQPDAPTAPLTPSAEGRRDERRALRVDPRDLNDGRITTGVWCGVPSARDGLSSYFLAGDATITDADGTPHEIRPASA
jgi:uncharacterized cupin superfamily protein